MSKILVVDDNQEVLKMLDKFFTMKKYEVIKADSGSEAIKLAKKQNPDLILLDIMMPDMEGTEVLDKIKKDKNTLRIPVIILSAKNDRLTKKYAAFLYSEAYITKPVKLDELEEKVRKVLSR